MTSFSVTVMLCKDPDTGSPWLHLPHVSSQRGCAPAPHSLLTPWCLSSTHVSWQPPSRWDFYPNCPRSFQWEWEAVPLLPTTPNTGIGSQLYSMFSPGSLSTFTDTLYIKNTQVRYRWNIIIITWYWRENSSKLFLFTSVYQFTQLQNWKALPIYYFSVFPLFVLLWRQVKELS